MDFKDIVSKRRSIRKFTDEPLTAEQTQLILRSALMSPTSHSTRAWHFIVIEDKQKLDMIAHCKASGAEFLSSASLAVIVLMDKEQTDVWIEDASIAAVTMQYQAADLGIGSCWAQLRNRGLADGTSADTILREMFSYPHTWEAECIIGFGHAATERKPQNEDNLKWENISIQ